MVSLKEPVLLTLFSILFIFEFPCNTSGNPLTKLQFMQLWKKLEDKVAEAFPSDDADDYADVLIRDEIETKNLTVFHQGNKKRPVFIRHRPNAHGPQKICVLRRGEDYLPPKNRNVFVVLRQMADAIKYSVHLAHVEDLYNIKDSKVTFDDGRVFQQKKLGKILDQIGDMEVQARSVRSQRPRCSWVGSWLLCDSTKNEKPVRERIPRKPLDEVEEAPKKPPGMSAEADTTGGGGGGDSGPGKNKRQIAVAPRQPVRRTPSPPPSAAGGKTGYSRSPAPPPPQPQPQPPPPPQQQVAASQMVADLGDGISEEDQKVVFKPEEKILPEPIAPAASENDNAESATEQRVLVPVQKAPAEKGDKDEEQQAPKKKHKKKHRKNKNKDNN